MPREEDRNKGTTNSQKTINKMTRVCPYLSILTSNVNVLNSQTKKHRMAAWVKKKKSK